MKAQIENNFPAVRSHQTADLFVFNTTKYQNQVKCDLSHICTDKIDESGLLACFSLLLRDSYFTDIDWVKLVNLRELDLSHSLVSELYATGLGELEMLDISYSMLTHLDTSQLPNLRCLNAVQTRLGCIDIKPLQRLETLRFHRDADYEYFDVIDFGNVACLTKLEVDAAVLNRAACSLFPALQALIITAGALEFERFGFPALRELVFKPQRRFREQALNYSKARGQAMFGENSALFPRLRSLHCTETDVDLAVCDQQLLEALGMRGAQFSTLNFMQLGNLKFLELVGLLSDQVEFSALWRLESLILRQTGVNCLDLTKMQCLRTLHVEEAALDLQIDTEMPNLRVLRLRTPRTRVFDAKCTPALLALHLSGTAVERLETAQLVELESLRLERNALRCLTLRDLPRLRNVRICGNKCQMSLIAVFNAPALAALVLRRLAAETVDLGELGALRLLELRRLRITRICAPPWLLEPELLGLSRMSGMSALLGLFAPPRPPSSLKQLKPPGPLKLRVRDVRVRVRVRKLVQKRVQKRVRERSTFDCADCAALCGCQAQNQRTRRFRRFNRFHSLHRLEIDHCTVNGVPTRVRVRGATFNTEIYAGGATSCVQVLQCENRVRDNTPDFGLFTRLKQLTLYSAAEAQPDFTQLQQLTRLEINANAIQRIDCSVLAALRDLEIKTEELHTLQLGSLLHLHSLRLQQKKATATLELDVSGLPALRTLLCDAPLLQIRFGAHPALESAQISGAVQSCLDLTQTPALACLNVAKCCVELLSVCGARQIAYLRIIDTNVLSLDLYRLRNLRYLYIINAKITELDVTPLAELALLHVEAPLQRLKTCSHAGLRDLRLWNARFGCLDLTEMCGLETLVLGCVCVSALRVGAGCGLRRLCINYAQFTALPLGATPHLRVLRVRNTALEYLDVEALRELVALETDLPLRRFDQAAHPMLRSLILDQEHAKQSCLKLQSAGSLRKLVLTGANLDLSGECACERLEHLELTGKSVDSLDLRSFPRVRCLDVSDSGILYLNIRNLGDIAALDAACALEHLDLGFHPNLAFLNLCGAKIAELDLFCTPNVEEVHISQSNVRILRFAALQRLRELYIDDTAVSRLDLRRTPSLELLDATNTPLRCCDVGACVRLQTLRLGGSAVRFARLQGHISIQYIQIGLSAHFCDLRDALNHEARGFAARTAENSTDSDTMHFQQPM